MSCKLFHRWVRMPEPNTIGASIKVCRDCGEAKRFNPHGHWMGIGIGIKGTYAEEIVEDFFREIKDD